MVAASALRQQLLFIFSGSGTMTIKNGSITNGASFASGMNSNAASIVAGNLTSPGGFVEVMSGNKSNHRCN